MTSKLVIMRGPEEALDEMDTAAAGLVAVENAAGRTAAAFRSLQDAAVVLDAVDVVVVLVVDADVEVRFFGGASEEGPRVTEFEA